jgi:hypothetical protein
MGTVLGMLMPKTMRAACARAPVSHFETPIHLMLRRSPSARRGVMGRRSQCLDGGVEKR